MKFIIFLFKMGIMYFLDYRNQVTSVVMKRMFKFDF